MRLTGPDTRYMMLYGGAWRPVTNMFDSERHPTMLALRACIAVLYAADDHWITTRCGPADLIERNDRDPEKREWDFDID